MTKSEIFFETSSSLLSLRPNFDYLKPWGLTKVKQKNHSNQVSTAAKPTPNMISTVAGYWWREIESNWIEGEVEVPAKYKFSFHLNEDSHISNCSFEESKSRARCILPKKTRWKGRITRFRSLHNFETISLQLHYRRIITSSKFVVNPHLAAICSNQSLRPPTPQTMQPRISRSQTIPPFIPFPDLSRQFLPKNN